MAAKKHVRVRVLWPKDLGLQAVTAVMSRIIVTVPLAHTFGRSRSIWNREREAELRLRLYAQKPRGEWVVGGRGGVENVPAVKAEQEKQRRD